MLRLVRQGRNVLVKEKERNRDTGHTLPGQTTGLFINYLSNDGFSNNAAKFHSKIGLLTGERAHFILFSQEL